MCLYFTLFRLWYEQQQKTCMSNAKISFVYQFLFVTILYTFKTFKWSRCKGLALTNTTRANIVILQTHQLYLLSLARHLHRLNLASIKKGNKRNGRIYVKSLTSVSPYLQNSKKMFWNFDKHKIAQMFPFPLLAFLATLVALVSTLTSHWFGFELA